MSAGALTNCVEHFLHFFILYFLNKLLIINAVKHLDQMTKLKGVAHSDKTHRKPLKQSRSTESLAPFRSLFLPRNLTVWFTLNLASGSRRLQTVKTTTKDLLL